MSLMSEIEQLRKEAQKSQEAAAAAAMHHGRNQEGQQEAAGTGAEGNQSVEKRLQEEMQALQRRLNLVMQERKVLASDWKLAVKENEALGHTLKEAHQREQDLHQRLDAIESDACSKTLEHDRSALLVSEKEEQLLMAYGLLEEQQCLLQNMHEIAALEGSRSRLNEPPTPHATTREGKAAIGK